MATVAMRDPRPGEGVKKGELLVPGAKVTVVGITPGANAAMAVVSWTNPEGKSQQLVPAAMEVALQDLPTSDQGTGSRELELEAARARIAAALPVPATPEAPIYVYLKDSTSGASMFLEPSVVEGMEESLASLRQAVEGLPVTHVGTVNSSALSRAVGINAKASKTSAALHTARAVFPQTMEQLRTVKSHGPQANALLLVAHVIGASVAKGGTGPSDAVAAAAAGAAAAPAAAAANPVGVSTHSPVDMPARKRARTKK